MDVKPRGQGHEEQGPQRSSGHWQAVCACPAHVDVQAHVHRHVLALGSSWPLCLAPCDRTRYSYLADGNVFGFSQCQGRQALAGARAHGTELRGPYHCYQAMPMAKA